MPPVFPPPDARRRAPLVAAASALLLVLVSLCSAVDASARQLPVLSVKGASVTEGDSGVTEVPVTVELSAPSAQTVTVQYRTTEYTAFAGSDFQFASGTLTFGPGVTQRTVSVSVIGDTVDELD